MPLLNQLVVPDVELHHQVDSVEELNVGAITLMGLHYFLLLTIALKKIASAKKEPYQLYNTPRRWVRSLSAKHDQVLENTNIYANTHF